MATIGAGYIAYSLVRLAIRAGRPAAFAHAAQLWTAERRLHLEPYLNHLAAAHTGIAELTGYYYGLLQFLLTPLALALLYLRKPTAFPRLRSGLVLTTPAANVVFWAWPVAPPRFSVPRMTDVLVTRDILGAGSPHGPANLANLYAAMPSLHVAWAAWCAVAAVTATRAAGGATSGGSTRLPRRWWSWPRLITSYWMPRAGLAATGLGMIAANWPGGNGPAGRQHATPARRTRVRRHGPACSSPGVVVRLLGGWLGGYLLPAARWRQGR